MGGLDPRVVLILAVLAGGYYIGEQAVQGIKIVDRKIVHVVKATGKKIGHVLGKVVGK